MKHFFVTRILFLFSFSLAIIFSEQPACAQVNLVPNPGFENFTTCPVGFSSFNGYVSNWTNPSAASPDYMNACASPLPAGAPANGTGYQVPHSGNGYAGAYLTPGLYKEYIQVHLTSPLIAGNLYDFKMYVVLHNKSQVASDDIGAYFSVTAPTSAGTAFLNGNPVAQVTNTPGNVITDTLNWTLISGTYTATGGEQYVTLGHFKTDAATTYLTVNFGSQGTYYYFDDVSLIPSATLPVELLSFDVACNVDHETQISWSTVSEQNLCCFDVEKSTDAKIFFPVAHVLAGVNSDKRKDYSVIESNTGENVYYRLRRTDMDGTFTYSQLVAFNGKNCFPEDAVPVAGIHDDELYFFNCPDITDVELFDAGGRMVFDKKKIISSAQMSFPVSGLAHGIYFTRLFNMKTSRCFMLKAISL